MQTLIKSGSALFVHTLLSQYMGHSGNVYNFCPNIKGHCGDVITMADGAGLGMPCLYMPLMCRDILMM